MEVSTFRWRCKSPLDIFLKENYRSFKFYTLLCIVKKDPISFLLKMNRNSLTVHCWWDGNVCVYLLWKVEGSDAQGPEAAEHGEKGQTQVVLRDHQREVALAVCITEVINRWVLGFKHSALRLCSGWSITQITKNTYNGICSCRFLLWTIYSILSNFTENCKICYFSKDTDL